MDDLQKAEEEMLKMWDDHYDWLIQKEKSQSVIDVMNEFRNKRKDGTRAIFKTIRET